MTEMTEPRSKLAGWLDREWRLNRQSREIAKLRAEVTRLQEQNERVQQAMRRCIPCEYRLEVLARRDAEAAPDVDHGS